jgi:hypothetical protein
LLLDWTIYYNRLDHDVAGRDLAYIEEWQQPRIPQRRGPLPSASQVVFVGCEGSECLQRLVAHEQHKVPGFIGWTNEEIATGS